MNKQSQRPSTFVGFWLALAGLFMLIALNEWQLSPPEAKGLDAYADEFSATRALAMLADVLQDQRPHPVGTAENQRVRDRIVTQLARLGVESQIQESFVCHDWLRAAPGIRCGTAQNILARLPGMEEPAVLLSVHYDSVGAGPGAGDDGAGVATVLETLRILKEEAPFRHPVIVLVNDGEEAGLLGATAFVRDHPWAKEVGAVINLEARGTAGPSFLFETSESNYWLISGYRRFAPHPATSSLYFEIYRHLPNDTDVTVYKKAGMPSVNFAFIDRVAHYHTPLDNLAHLDPRSVQHHGDNALAMVRFLADADLSDPPSGNAVYVDLLGFAVILWPESWTPPIAMMIVLLFIVIIWTLRRAGWLTYRSLAWGLVAWIVLVVTSVLIGLVLGWLVPRLAGSAQPWYAYPLAFRAALWLGVGSSTMMAAVLFARRAGFWGLALAAWLWFSLLGLAVALFLTGASVYFILPAGLAALAFATTAAGRWHHGRLNQSVVVLCAWLAALWWLALVRGFEMAMGLGPTPLITVPLSIIAGFLLPLLAWPSHGQRVRKRLALVSVLALIVVSVIALWVPPYSELFPQRLNIRYIEDKQTGQAFWAVGSASEHFLPKELLSAAAFEGIDDWPYKTGIGRPAYRLPAEPMGLPAVRLESLSDRNTAGGRELIFRLVSPEEAIVWLDIPARVEPIDFNPGGSVIAFDDGDVRDGHHILICQAACNGREFTLRVAADGPFDLQTYTVTAGVPKIGAALQMARPATAVPSYFGDATVVVDRITLGTSLRDSLSINQIAEDYVKVILAVGEHDTAYVDAYYGPADWAEEAKAQALSLPRIRGKIDRLLEDLTGIKPVNDAFERLRREYLSKQLQSVRARIDMLEGKKFSFDEEIKALYDAVSPPRDSDYFQPILDEIDELVPGDGALAERVETYRRQFIIPRDKLDAVFAAAIDECRQRSKEHIHLPNEENFVVEYVTDKPWSGYNWYQGDSFSLIQINTDLPIFIDRAVDLGCHEGYPGHHAYNALLEYNLVKERGWIEFTIYPLFSPQSLIAEGSAVYGTEMAFPGDERVGFERDVLYPLAGLDPSEAERYAEIERLTTRLSPASNEAARGYLDGTMTREEAVDFLITFRLLSPERARQRMDFIDEYRGYVINYNLGEELVRDYIDAMAGDDKTRRWQVFGELLASPRLPSSLLQSN